MGKEESRLYDFFFYNFIKPLRIKQTAKYFEFSVFILKTNAGARLTSLYPFRDVCSIYLLTE